MPTHSIYSVRDKRKVDAEVIDIREVSGAKGVRYQIVGRHPEDGTTVTTFCSAAVAEDYRARLGDTAQHAAESVDHIPQPEALVVSTDGTPIDDDLDTFVEDPLVGSASQGTLTSAKVLAAEGKLSKTSCCCGATEDKPCACMTADEPMQCSSTEPKCACYAALDAKAAEGCPCTNCGCGKAAETVAGIDIQTPSQIAVETPDSDELIVPDPDLLVNGDGRVLGQQTGAVNTTPLHAEGGEAEGYSVDDLANMQFNEIDQISGFIADRLNHTQASWSELSVNERKKILNKIQKNEPWMGWSAENGHTEEQITFIKRKGYEPDMVCSDCFSCFEDGEHSCQSGGLCGCSWEDLEEYDAEGGRDFDNPDVRTFKPQEALEYLRSGDNTVWLIDYSDYNYGDDEYPHYDYPIEDPDELSAMIEDGVFEDHEQFGEIVIANDTSYALGMWKDQPGGKHPSYAEFESEPAFARNNRVLIPTAVLGGLALAYLAKPELLSGSFDRISDLLGKLTKKGDKTE